MVFHQSCIRFVFNSINVKYESVQLSYNKKMVSFQVGGFQTYIVQKPTMAQLINIKNCCQNGLFCSDDSVSSP